MSTKDGLRILWKSNAPHVGSGYGVQANSLLPRLLEHPAIEDIGIFGYFGIMGGLTSLPVGRNIPGVRPRTMLHYPLGGDIWGNDIVWDHAKHFDAHAIITLMDVWVLREDYGHGGFLWVPYAPVDHDPIPPAILDRLRRAFHPVVYSKHASGELARNGLEHTYIPHGVETKLYRPMGRATRNKAKRWLNFDSSNFVIGIVGANRGWPPRKGFTELMEAFAVFSDRHPEARLLLHSGVSDEMHAGGPDLTALSQLYGIADKVRITRPYLIRLGFSTQEMCRLYNAMDVFCLPSMGEGFGIPLIEAQACGVPVIATDWTACSELVGAGWKVPIAKKFPTPLKSFMAFASVPALVDAMEEAYQVWKRPEAREEYSVKARAFAMQYDWERLVRDGWFPFIDWLWEQVRPKLIQRPELVSEKVEVAASGS
jgi:glycosyltransferase involved in cell wall biosynthesis